MPPFKATNNPNQPAAPDNAGGTATAVKPQRQAIKPPPMYRVLLLNDDFTPMEFVTDILQKIFHMGVDRATQVMLDVHHNGRGVCGIYSQDIAATKIRQVMALAKEHQHPLQCLMEKNT